MYNNYVLHMYVHVCVGNFNCVRSKSYRYACTVHCVTYCTKHGCEESIFDPHALL